MAEKNIQQVSDFTDIVDNINDLDFSDNQRYIICDYNNPQNHMEVSTSLETHTDGRQYVNTEFKVFKDNEEQKCSVFPHGKFTHFSRTDGTNSSQQGAEHWDKMKKEMKEKGGFSDNVVVFYDEENYKKFVETGKIDFPSEDETEQEIVQEEKQDTVQEEVQEEVQPKEVSKPKATKKAVSSQEQQEFFENFMQDNTQKQSVAMARQIDKINALESKIERLKSVKEDNKKTIKVMNEFVKNNAFPFLNPVAKAFSNQIDKSSQKIDRQIKKAEKKIRKAKQKREKIRIKQKIAFSLSAFVRNLRKSDTKQIAYTNGIQALQQNSLLNAMMKMNDINERLERLHKKLKNSNTEVQKVNISEKIKKLTGQKSELQAKIKKLNGLEKSLMKFSETPLSLEKSEEIAKSAIDTAEKSAMENKSLFEILDGLTNQAERNLNLQEEQAQVQVNKGSLMKKSNLTEEQVLKLMGEKIPINIKKTDDDKFTVIYDSSQSQKVNQTLAQMKKDASETQQTSQTAKQKR